MKQQAHIVCLGGGIGTVNLLRGLKKYSDNLTTIVSMADDGGSAGRLRRLYSIHPPGDIVSCMAALSKNPLHEKLLTYRFPGDRYAEDHHLPGHKLGNLMMVAARDITGDFIEGMNLLKELFQVEEKIFPATTEHVSIWAETIEGKKVVGEENIDLGKYEGKRVLKSVHVVPENPQVSKDVLENILSADVIIAGPGDLYTNVLPVLIVPKIAQTLRESKARKVFVINVANKPFETKGYNTNDFMKAIRDHLGFFPFEFVFINNNFTQPIPKKFHYTYVQIATPDEKSRDEVSLITSDYISQTFPLYHDSEKLASAIVKTV